MTYKGHVENGNIVLDDPVNLQDGSRIEFWIVDTPSAQQSVDAPSDVPRKQLHPELERMRGFIRPGLKDEKDYYDYLVRKYS